MTKAGPPKPRNRKPATAPRTRRRKSRTQSPQELLELVEKSLDDDQADDVAVIDLTGKTAIADFMVIASGRNPRHITAMAEHLKEKIKATGAPSPPIEGLPAADWVLVDGGDIIVHLFRPETRKIYNLEKMWGWTSAHDTAPRRGSDRR